MVIIPISFLYWIFVPKGFDLSCKSPIIFLPNFLSANIGLPLTVLDSPKPRVIGYSFIALNSLFFHSGPIRNVQDVEKCDFRAFKHYFHGLLERGIYIAPSQYEAGFISLAHTEEILDIAITQVDAALKDVVVPA